MLPLKARGLAPSLDSACFAVEQLKPCHGLSAPENGARSPEKQLHPAGATVHFSCAPGYVLKGQASIKCVPGHPSHWSDPPPICRAASLDGFYSGRSLDVAKAPAASSTLDAAHIAAAIFLPLVAMALLAGGVYLYFSRLQGKSPLQLPRTRPRPYDRITVESAFDNPTYDTGVSICARLNTLIRTQFYAPLGRSP